MLLKLCVCLSLCSFGALWSSEAMDSSPELPSAEKRWDEQSSSAYAPKHGGPYLSGSYVWGGRADRAYKAFQQWELQLQAGAKGAADLQIQITPLDAEMKVQHLFRKKAAPWKAIDGLDADGKVIVSYALNCSKVYAYEIALKWSGNDGEAGKQAEQVYFAGDPFMLPIDKSALKHQAFIVTSNPDFKYKRSRKRATVTFHISNLGGAAAQEVENTIVFVDQDGEEVHRETFQPNEGTIEAGYSGVQTAKFKKVPKFHNISIKTRQSVSLTYSWEGDSAVVPEDVILRKLRYSDGALTGKIINGFPDDLANVVVTITFEGEDGETVKTVVIKIPSLSAGAEHEFSQEMDEFIFTAYAMSFSCQ